MTYELHQAIKHAKRYVARGGSQFQSVEQIARRFALTEDDVRAEWDRTSCTTTRCSCYLHPDKATA